MIYFLYIFFLSSFSFAQSDYDRYWLMFDKNQKVDIEEARRRFSDQKNMVITEFSQMSGQHYQSQRDLMIKAVEKYRDQLSSSRGKEVHLSVLLNMSKLMIGLGSTTGESRWFEDAIFTTSEILEDFPHAADEALYIKAIAQERLKVDATGTWLRLSKVEKKSKFVFIALLNVGDGYFKRKEDKLALTNYQKALKIKQNIEVMYRYMWASHLTGNISEAYSSAFYLLKNKDVEEDYLSDAVDVVSQTLYEQDSLSEINGLIDEGSISSERIGFVFTELLNLYSVSKLHNRLLKVGSTIYGNDPSHRDSYRWLEFMANSARAMGKKKDEIGYLEQIALFLPFDSYWRSQNSIKAGYRMQSSAVLATQAVADYLYSKGMQEGNSKKLKRSGALYLLLVRYNPTAIDVNSWRLRSAHTHYLASEYQKSIHSYQSMIDKNELTDNQLEIAYYQLMLSREKLWLNTKTGLKEITKTADMFANRFPQSNRTPEILLIAAAIHAQNDNSMMAVRFWERALLAKPTPEQKRFIISGIIDIKLKNKQYGDVFIYGERFLSLDSTLGIRTRVLAAIAESAAAMSDSLTAQGKPTEAAQMLAELVKRYPDLPNAGGLFVSSLKKYAVSGMWAELRNELPKESSSADVTYLSAKTSENLLQFKDAANKYVLFAIKFPEDPRALGSLKVAERLADIHSLQGLSGRVALLLAARAKNSVEQYESLKRAYNYEQDAFSSAAKIARQMRKVARTLPQQLEAEVYLAKALAFLNQQNASETMLTTVVKTVEVNKGLVNRSDIKPIYASALMLIGRDALDQLVDFDLVERSGSQKENIGIKTRYFKKVTDTYDKVALLNLPEYSPEARYELAEAAKNFADNLEQVSRAKNITFAKRLREIARRYHMQNIRRSKSSPRVLADNLWVKKSMMNLVSSNEVKEYKYSESIPASYQMEMPYQWKL